MLGEFDKVARSGERARIEQLIAGQEARVRRAFRKFLDDVRSDAVRRQVRLALEQGGVDSALKIVDQHVARVGAVLSAVFQDSGVQETRVFQQQFDRAGVAVSFDPSHPRAAQLMRQNRLQFVTEFSRKQAEATRAALQEALQEGAGTAQTARAFRDSIGLTEAQRLYVANYRRALERQDYAAARGYDTRDRRYDPKLERLAAEQRLLADREPLGAKKIQQMVERMRARLLQYRAETIARTETQTVVNQARNEALAQVLEQAGLPDTVVEQEWRATMDSRTRDTHVALNGQRQPRGQPFVSVSGARMMFPGDRSLGAPPEELINCRCTLLTRIRP